MVGVEVCINCDNNQSVTESVAAAYAGGAATVELCSAMDVDGLTPQHDHIIQARKAFQDRCGLMVMIRPRKGDFNFSQAEFLLMQDQIKSAANLGADGVVLGILQGNHHAVAINKLSQLIELCHKYKLISTFHRAFDATPDQLESLEILINAGADRVLTAGTSWRDRKPATDGIINLRKIIESANNRIEVVISGGINSQNVGDILQGLPVQNRRVSVHAFTAVQQNGVVTESSVRNLVNAAKINAGC